MSLVVRFHYSVVAVFLGILFILFLSGCTSATRANPKKLPPNKSHRRKFCNHTDVLLNEVIRTTPQYTYSVREIYKVNEKEKNETRYASRFVNVFIPRYLNASMLQGCTKHHQVCSIPKSLLTRKFLKYPRCGPAQDNVGCWYPSSEVKRHPGVLSYVRGLVSGEVEQALSWPMVWLPKGCQYHRYGAEDVFRCSKEYVRLNPGPTPLWIYFLGDSASRGNFCGLLRLLNGSEVNGQVPLGPCQEILEDGSFSALTAQSAEQEFSYDFPEHSLKVSWHFAYELGSPKILDVLKDLLLCPKSKQTKSMVLQPTVLVFNAGAFDLYDHVNGNEGVRTKRMSRILKVLQKYKFGGWFYFRNNPCNVLYDVRSADEYLEPMVLANARRKMRVLNIYPFSTGRGTDLLWRDGLHFDRTEDTVWKKLWVGRPHVGELNLQILQHLLNSVCNPYLFSAAAAAAAIGTDGSE